MSHQTSHQRVLRKREVIERVGISGAQIYKLMGMNDFPKQIQLSERAVGWREADIDRWIKSRRLVGQHSDPEPVEPLAPGEV